MKASTSAVLTNSCGGGCDESTTWPSFGLGSHAMLHSVRRIFSLIFLLLMVLRREHIDLICFVMALCAESYLL